MLFLYIAYWLNFISLDLCASFKNDKLGTSEKKQIICIYWKFTMNYGKFLLDGLFWLQAFFGWTESLANQSHIFMSTKGTSFLLKQQIRARLFTRNPVFNRILRFTNTETNGCVNREDIPGDQVLGIAHGILLVLHIVSFKCVLQGTYKQHCKVYGMLMYRVTIYEEEWNLYSAEINCGGGDGF